MDESAIKANKEILNTVFRNVVECDHCGELYAIEFTLRRYLERHDMNTECLFCGHIQTTPLSLRTDMGSCAMKYSDHVEFERSACYGN